MSKLWVKSAAIRALKTFAQTFLATITVGQAIAEINWIQALSVSAVAALASILTSIVGLPEVEYGDTPASRANVESGIINSSTVSPEAVEESVKELMKEDEKDDDASNA